MGPNQPGEGSRGRRMLDGTKSYWCGIRVKDARWDLFKLVGSHGRMIIELMRSDQSSGGTMDEVVLD